RRARSPTRIAPHSSAHVATRGMQPTRARLRPRTHSAKAPELDSPSGMRAAVFLLLVGCASSHRLDGGEDLEGDEGGSTDGTTISLDGLVVQDGGSNEDTGVVPMGCMGQP